MIDDHFEWSDRKSATNEAKHGVSFETARLVFDGPFAIEGRDLRESYDEERYVIIGMVDNRLLFIAYTMRGNRIRIISARGAEPYERRKYHEANS
jgi:uncharacterized DUF497 family protein